MYRAQDALSRRGPTFPANQIQISPNLAATFPPHAHSLFSSAILLLQLLTSLPFARARIQHAEGTQGR